MRVKDIRPWVNAGVLVRSKVAGWLPGAWVDEAVCAQVDPEVWFPEGKGQSWRVAARICDGCPVKDMCLSYAVVTDERTGVWGGLSERQRYRLKSLPIPGTRVVVQLLARKGGPKSAVDVQVAALTAGGASAASIAEATGRTARSVQRARARNRRAAAEQVDAAA